MGRLGYRLGADVDQPMALLPDSQRPERSQHR
jgi:hypothetical protein